MSEVLLRVSGLKVALAARRAGRRRILHAVRGVDLEIFPHETLGLVGESGSGKSTTARAILGLQSASEGSIVLKGRELAGNPRERTAVAGTMQAVFQDPFAALDPSMTIGANIAEPLRVCLGLDKAESEGRVGELLEMVNLPKRLANAYPRDLSGGQRQRVNIARAIATNPELVVLDEPLSALDMSTQSHVFNLLESLRKKLGMSYLFIAHDLAMVHYASTRIAVMYLGSIVESGSADSIYSRPCHPYTRALVASAPIADPVEQAVRRQARRQLVAGELPSPFAPPSGCAYHPRCPAAFDRCRVESPVLQLQPDGRQVACHLQDAHAAQASTVVRFPATV